jgi:carboxyl-terminal processing protease
MEKYRKLLWAIPMVGLMTFFSFRTDDRLFEIARNLDIYATLFKKLNAYYVDDINPNQLIKTSIDGMLQSLDPYTVYYGEDDIEDFMTMTTGKYNGIGALISNLDGKNTVLMIYKDTPAQKAGLQIGDEILKIDDFSLTNRPDFDLTKLLRGQSGTQVNLTVKRFGQDQPFIVPVSRDVVKINNVSYYTLLNDEVGYIDLKDFTGAAYNDVRNAFQKLKSQGMKKVVLDLRDNPGGLLDMAIDISNIFIPKGQEIVSTRGKVNEWNKVYKANNPALDTEIPIVVLINNRSASAAEIVSGVIQDYDRGVLMGQRTFGKGLVQTTLDVSYNTKMKVTTAKYYIPSGRCIQAIDYTHRNEDGSVGKIADSLITEYKTKNGRPVFDGGGVLPDLETEKETLTPLATTLLRKRLIFDYAIQYKSAHSNIKSAGEFELTDPEYKTFTQWLEDKEYDYTTQTEKDLAALEASASKEKTIGAIANNIKDLKAKLHHTKDQDLEHNKQEIKRILEEEIIKHYYLETGLREASIKTDPDIKSALALFSDMNKYQQLLRNK